MNKFQDFSKDILKKNENKIKIFAYNTRNILKMQVRQKELYKLKRTKNI